MSPMYDIYVATKNRTTRFVKLFLDKFLPLRRELSKIYEVPFQEEEIKETFQSADELMIYLENNPTAHHVIYWVSTEKSGARRAIVAPTSDGGMILGLSCDEEDEELELWLCEALKKFVGSKKCLSLFETPPPATLKEFDELVESEINELRGHYGRPYWAL